MNFLGSAWSTASRIIDQARANFSASRLPLLELPAGFLIKHIYDSESDGKALVALKDETIVGIDFEWNPDRRGISNPLMLAQVATKTACYIWHLYLFHGPPDGLHDLLINSRIVKVGCHVGGADARKMAQFGFQVLDRSKTQKLIPGFIDIQKFKDFADVENQPLTSSLDNLAAFWLAKRLPRSPKFSHVDWSSVAKDPILENYVVMDAYSTLLISIQQEDHKKNGTPIAGHPVSTEETALNIAPPVDRYDDPEHMASLMIPALTKEDQTRMELSENTIYQVQFIKSFSRLEMILVEDSEGFEFTHRPWMQLYQLDQTGNRFITFAYQFTVDFYPDTNQHIVVEKHALRSVEHDKTYLMKQLHNSTPFDRMVYAAKNWSEGISSLLKNVILGDPEPIPESANQIFPPMVAIEGHQLNDCQIEAVNFSLARPFSLIHGPPGTGKTHTLTAIAHTILTHIKHNNGPTLLMCAPSNEAADNLAEMLVKTGIIKSESELVIIKGSWKHHLPQRETIKKYMLHMKVEHLFGSQIDHTDRETIKSFERKCIKRARVICCTLSMSGSRLLRDTAFSHLIIDEASQCVEAECLIAIAHRIQNLTMAGDHKQLRPVIQSKLLKNSCLTRSLFERLVEVQKENCRLLSIQYRMHPSISWWPSHNIYEGKLIDAPDMLKKRRLPVSFAEMLPALSKGVVVKHPNILVHVKGTTDRDRLTASYFNSVEAELAINLFRLCSKHFSGKEDVVILSPYKAQVQYINKRERRKVAYTVAQFQGREAEIIIFTCARSSIVKTNAEPHLGFANDPHLINVSLTRAKYAQIVVGDVALLKTSPMWSSVIEYHHEMLNTCYELSEGPVPHLRLLDPSKIKQYVWKKAQRKQKQTEASSSSNTTNTATQEAGDSKIAEKQQPVQSKPMNTTPSVERNQAVIVFKCLYCQKVFKLQSALDAHSAAKHPTSPEISSNNPSTSPTAIKQTASSSLTSFIGSSKVASSGFKCRSCQKVFKSQIGLDAHSAAKHPTTQQQKSSNNDVPNVAVTQTATVASSSLAIASSVGPSQVASSGFKCGSCQKVFKSQIGLDAHSTAKHPMIGSKAIVNDVTSIHPADITKDAPETATMGIAPPAVASNLPLFLTCQSCAKVFRFQEALDEHNSVKHPGLKDAKAATRVFAFECTYCLKIFLTQAGLDSHMTNKHQNAAAKSNIAQVGSATVAQSSSSSAAASIQSPTPLALVSQPTHSPGTVAQSSSSPGIATIQSPAPSAFVSQPKNGFECRSCSKVFHLQTALDAHTKAKHKAAKKSSAVNCSYCKQSFATKAAWEDHCDTVHYFECPRCEEDFYTVKQLRKHMKKIHFGCKLCNRGFKSESSLKEHQRAVHPPAASSSKKVSTSKKQ